MANSPDNSPLQKGRLSYSEPELAMKGRRETLSCHRLPETKEELPSPTGRRYSQPPTPQDAEKQTLKDKIGQTFDPTPILLGESVRVSIEPAAVESGANGLQHFQEQAKWSPSKKRSDKELKKRLKEEEKNSKRLLNEEKKRAKKQKKFQLTSDEVKQEINSTRPSSIP